MQDTSLPNHREKDIRHPEILLVPIIPSSIPRYDGIVNDSTKITGQIIPAVTRFSADEERTIEDWVELTSPEGDNYGLHRNRRIITNTDIRVPSNQQNLLAAHDNLLALGREKDSHIVDCEVYLQIAVQTRTGIQVQYYFVDRLSRSLFWVHDILAQDVGLSGFESIHHLKNVILPEYWTHLEYFCMHQPLDKTSEAQLISIFRHGCTDDMTSFGSTFPYSAQECRDHLRVLEGFAASNNSSGQRTATFARLWSSITRVRNINFYGLSEPRLDRSQGLAEFKNTQKPTFVLRILDLAFLRLPQSNFHRITELWNGRVVFQRHWHPYLEEKRGEWLRQAVISSVISLTSIIIIVLDAPNSLVVASASLAWTSVVGALVLYETHSRSKLLTASDISNWIMNIEGTRSGLLPLAIKFSIPQATSIYSAFFLICALLQLIVQHVHDVSATILLMAAVGPAALMFMLTALI